MWSGPRTVSTALMRAWENRPDTAVVDEPLYAFYLARTGIDHPGRDEIIASMRSDWRVVLDQLTRGPVPGGKAVFYAKHMTHHLLPEVDRRALAPLRHAHLIRDPAELLASYAKVRSAPTMADLGIAAQAEIYEEFGGPVLDSRDLLEHPEPMLRALCAALDVPFDPAMLSWPPGPRDSDGVWGPLLVCGRLGVDRVRPVPAPGRAAARASGHAGRGVPPVLRAAACAPAHRRRRVLGHVSS